MSTLRVSNIEAKADASSPTVNEKIKITNSNGDVLIHVNGETSGITSVGVNTTGKTFDVDINQNVSFPNSIAIGTTNPTESKIVISHTQTSTVKHLAIKDSTNNWVRKLGVDSSNNFGIFSGDTEHLRITSGGTVESYSPDDTTPNIKFRSDDTNWYGALNQSVENGTITSFLSCGGDWTASGTTYSATKALAAYPTAAIAVHNQYNSTWGSQFSFLSKAGGSTTTDGDVVERFRIENNGDLNTIGNDIKLGGSNDLRIVGLAKTATYGWDGQPGIYAANHQEFRMHSGFGDMDLYVDGFGHFNQGVKGAFVDVSNAAGGWTMAGGAVYTWNANTVIPADVWVSMIVFLSSTDTDQSDHFDVIVGPNSWNSDTWGDTNAASTPTNDHSIVTHPGDSQDVLMGY